MTHPRYYDVQQAITEVVGNRLDASDLEQLVPAVLRAAGTDRRRWKDADGTAWTETAPGASVLVNAAGVRKYVDDLHDYYGPLTEDGTVSR